MQFLPEDEYFLQRALDLARDAAAFASPNPAVGCALAQDGKTIGEGAHYYDNRDHAEIAALKQAANLGHAVRGATAYVTLEPCSHHGRTGPCSNALIEAGIARCVVATVDPNPLVRGQGLERLRAAGVEVVVADVDSALAQQARRLNDAFAFAIQHQRPFVTLKAAVSRDGFLAPRVRQEVAPHWLTGPAARADVQMLRHASDAIVTGIGTVIADNPSLTDRTGLSRRRRLLRVVLDSRLRISPCAELLRDVDGDVLIVASEDVSEESVVRLTSVGAEVARVATLESGGLDLRAVLELLHHRQMRSVLLEGGSALNGSFLEAGLVDKVVIYHSAVELGSDAVPFAANGVSPQALESELVKLSRVSFPGLFGEDVRLSGYVRDPWQDVLLS